MGNEMRERKYWMKERQSLRRICGWKEEGWKHVLWWCKKGEEGSEETDTRKNEGNSGGRQNQEKVDEEIKKIRGVERRKNGERREEKGK